MTLDEPHRKRFFCYVDESGQDTRGELFVVAVVVVAGDREALLETCERAEKESGKGRVKWIKTRYARRVAYVRRLLELAGPRVKACFAIHRHSRDYATLTTRTVAAALRATGETDYKATVFIDGLPRSQERPVGSCLRHLGISVRKVRGVRREENDPLIRLADAICGLVRAAHEGQRTMKQLVSRGLEAGILCDVSQK